MEQYHSGHGTSGSKGQCSLRDGKQMRRALCCPAHCLEEVSGAQGGGVQAELRSLPELKRRNLMSLKSKKPEFVRQSTKEARAT